MCNSRYIGLLVTAVFFNPLLGPVVATERPRSDIYDTYCLGRAATEEDIRAWNIDVAPDGSGLPFGKGSAREGAKVYGEYCAVCHGATGVERPSLRLVGGQGSLSTQHPDKTIGSYWPYATTMFDYIYRAMPYTAPQSLTSGQVYSVVAWLLFRNGIIAEDLVLDAHSLQTIRMPNREGFVPDPRPDTRQVGDQSAPSSDLGDIDFPTSGPANARKHFHLGVLLLHNFEYDDAAEAFRRAQSVDPDFAMAYWGEAMTYNHPLWDEQDREGARMVLERLGPTAEARRVKATTAREQAYLEAVERLYGDGDKPARDRSYEAAMGALAAAYPTDLEARAFYALAVLGSKQGKRDGVSHLLAGVLAESVFHQNPRHPGALHYLIHAYDDPQHASQALQAAQIYGTLASAAPHALHMPSHIFMALGRWGDVVKANELAWQSSEDRIRRKGLGLEARSYHILSWLMYGYLQQGRYVDAKRLLDIVEMDARTIGNPHVKDVHASMRATYMVEAQAWDTRGVEDDRTTLGFSSAVSELFAIGMSGVRMGDLITAKKALALIRDRVERLPAGKPSSSTVAGQVIVKELEGLIMISENRTEQGLALLREAVELQDALPYEYGPPFPVKSSHELLGEVLLNAGRLEEARRHFEAALLRTPQRAGSLQGLSRIHP